jgi:hypothetical protein
LWIDEQRVIYRVNDQLLEAKIADGKLLAPLSLATGQEIPGVHWLFKGPGT